MGALLLLAALTGAPAEAPLPRALDALPCFGPGAEIIVCGRRSGTPEPYRLPAPFREAPLESRNYSWSARARDEREAGRYDSQAVGPGGAFTRQRQTECEWRAERQAIN